MLLHLFPVAMDRQIVLATRNPGKLAEMRALLAGLPFTLVSAADFPEVPEIEEDLPTLEGNARKKAETLLHFTGLPALADDTGLEVTALNGRPGVHSARYAGPAADPAANRALLLKELQGVSDRRARFRTVIAFATSEGTRLVEGICTGSITERERGSGGFGYDALFLPDGHTRTFAELDAAEKNAISHRGSALRQMKAHLQAEQGG